MDQESISVAPNEEQGNVSVETEVPEPIETTETETPAAEVETTKETPVAESVIEKFKLPDGREVTGEELYKEHTEKLLPEFTRRSQELATLKQGKDITKPANPLEDPEYAPKTYAELAAQIEAQTLAKLEAKETARIEQQKSVETAIEGQLSEIKKTDPSLNETALFLHASKYGFRDLKVAHQNMKDMSMAIKTVKQQTANDIAKRTDPVSVIPGATGARPNASHFSTAIDYLNAVKASGKS